MLSNLNEQQQQAVLAVEGPVMVFAGAGSGKTRTLTYRVAYMINEKNIDPYHILAITFTNKATNEMRERLIHLVGEHSHDVTISTFHSLCARILRKEITALGYSRDFTIIDEDEQLKIINQVLKDANTDRKEFSGKKLQKVLNYTKCFSVKSTNPAEQALFDTYEERMHSLNLLDFEDLLLKVHDLFRNFPEIREKYASRYQYILVDEFQDTNLIQYEIVKLLAEKSRNLFVVGDDDQSIYSFRGTNYENMNLYKKDFPEYQLFLLNQNYRSTQVILDGCNRLIANNKNRQKKELFSEIPGNANDVEIFQAYNEKLEVDYILDQIFTMKLRGEEYSSIAILYRNSVLLRNVELGIIQMGLPYRVFGGISYLRRREVKDIIAYLKLIVNHEDLYSFERIINVPARAIGDATIGKVMEIRKKYKISLFEAIDACKTILSDRRYLALTEFKDLILKLTEEMNDHPLIEVYDHLLEAIHYIDYLKEEEDSEERIENIEEFKSILLQIEEETGTLSRIERLEEAFDEAILSDDARQNQKESINGLTLSTIHSVKGLEFDTVFVIGLEENVFPNSYRFSSEEELEEERRIAYVAFTRAKKKLYLLSAQNRLLYGERFTNKTSRFVFEFTGVTPVEKDPIIDINQDHNYQYEKPKTAEPKKVELLKGEDIPKYKVGDKVIHSKFGEGIIIAIESGEIGQIFFDQTKKLTKILLSHPALRKR